MKGQLKKLLAHPLISGSSIVFIGSFIASFLSYLFIFLMGRKLSVSDLGLLVTLTSALALFGIFPTAFTGIFARFAAKYHSNRDETGMTSLLYGGFQFLTYVSLMLFLVFIVSFPFFSSYLHITDPRLLILTGLLVILSIYASLYLGFLQGKLLFYQLSFVNILGQLLKIIFAFTLLFAGFKLFGVMTGLTLAAVVPLGGMLYILFKKKNHIRVHASEQDFLSELKRYGLKFFLSSMGITLFTSLDVILVRHFFSPTITGQYVALAFMGKAIFYLTSPIYFVFFPLIVQKKERKENVTNTLFMAIGIILICSTLLSLLYFFFPGLVLKIFFPGKEYAKLAQYLGPYSIYILLFSLASLCNNFFLSIGKTNVYKVTLGCALLFVILLTLFHTNLMQVIWVLVLVALVLLLLLLLYFRYGERD